MCFSLCAFSENRKHEKSSIHRSDTSEGVTFSSCFNLLAPQTSGNSAVGTSIPMFLGNLAQQIRRLHA